MRETRKHAIDRSALKQELPPDEPVILEEKPAENILEKPESSAAETGKEDPQIHPKKKTQKKGRGKVALILIAVVILLAVTCFKIYVDNDYEPFHTHDEYQEMAQTEIVFSDNVIALEDLDRDGDAKKTGFIFYGDNKIQRECYLPLMIELSNMGYSVYLPTTFGNIPILNLEGAAYVSRTYSHVKTWYIVAHGQACPVAAKYASSHASEIAGLIFLGGYSKTDLSETSLRLFSITGSNDTILDQAEYVTMKTNDPRDTVYFEIDGGNHTGFTDTFLIRKDSEATISSEEQIHLTATAIETFLAAK